VSERRSGPGDQRLDEPADRSPGSRVVLREPVTVTAPRQ
jgi:hypothetical protein